MVEKERRPFDERPINNTFNPAIRHAVEESRELFPRDGEETRIEHTKPRTPFAVISDASGYLRSAAYEQMFQELGRQGVRYPERTARAAEHAERVVSPLVDTKSRWIYQVPDGPEILNLSLPELQERMVAIVAPVYEGVSPSLEAWQKGFNDHTLPHAKKVTDDVLWLLKRARVSGEERKIALVATLSHDIGNLVGRGDHAVASATMLAAIMPNFRKGNHENWKRVRQAITYHDSDLVKYLAEQEELSSIERIAGAREALYPATLALMMADSMHMGPDRLSKSVMHMNAYEFDRDPHIRVNNEGKSEGLQFSSDGSELTWTIVFNPALQVRQHRTPSDFDTWKNLVLGIYPDRLRKFTYAGFALFPQLDTIVIRLEKCVGGEEDEAFVTVFRPGRIEEKLEEIQKRLPSHLRKKQSTLPIGGK